MSSASPGPSIEDNNPQRTPRAEPSAAREGAGKRGSAEFRDDATTHDDGPEKVKIQSPPPSGRFANATRRQTLELERAAREAIEEDEDRGIDDEDGSGLEATRDAADFVGTESDMREPTSGPLVLDLEPLQLNLESSLLDIVTDPGLDDTPSLSLDIDNIALPSDRAPRERTVGDRREAERAGKGARRPTTDDLITQAVRAADRSGRLSLEDEDEWEEEDKPPPISDDSGPAGLLPAGRPKPLTERLGSGRKGGSSRRRATGRRSSTGRALSLPRDQEHDEKAWTKDIFLYLAILFLVVMTFLLITAL